MNGLSTKAKILIVEDDPVVARLYRGQLEGQGYSVEIATDGQAGFTRLHQVRPDVVLLDLMLPRMNGVDLLKKIRTQASFKETPVVVLTNAYVPLMVRDAYDAGATVVHNKSSFGLREMLDVLRECLPEARWEARAASGEVGSAASELRPSGLGPHAAQLAQARNAFLAQMPSDLAALRPLLRQMSQAFEEGSRQRPLAELYRQLHTLTGKAALVGLQPLAQVASALEALLNELLNNPAHATPSALRTVVNAVDFLHELGVPGLHNKLLQEPPLGVLVVDDDPLSRRALTTALEKNNLRVECVDQAGAALDLLRERTFDSIFLDVGMPGMDGFALCQNIRASGRNQNTPVVFVTNHTDFKDRVQSTLSGANDFVAKPFLFIEVTVKALVFSLRHRLQQNPNRLN